MKSLHILLIIFLFNTIDTYSQEIKEGFIISKRGDYKYGTLLIDQEADAYTVCKFKEGSSTEFTTYSPEVINGYGILNATRYVSREIKLDGKPGKVFLKGEFEGLIKLYSYKDRVFIEKDSFFEIIPSEPDLNKKTLQDWLKSCQNISSSINRTKYTINSLASLLDKYEKCARNDFILDPKLITKMEVVAGVELNNTSLSSNYPRLRFVNSDKLKDKTLLSAGLNLTVSSPKLKNISVCTGMFFYQQEFYLIAYTEQNGKNYIDKINFDYQEILIPINIQFHLAEPAKKVVPYVKGGISIPITFNSALTLEHEEEYNDEVFFESYDLLKTYKESLQLNMSTGVTFQITKKIRGVGEIGFITEKGILTLDPAVVNETIKQKSNRVNILIGIRF